MEKTCTRCKLPKPINEFGRVAKNKDGLSTWCKKCNSEYHKKWHSESETKVKDLDFGLNGANRNDYLAMYNFMIHLGYNPDEDVSKQFCEKYNLVYKRRKKRDINAFTYQELKKPPK
jgi:hypothetical protein